MPSQNNPLGLACEEKFAAAGGKNAAVLKMEKYNSADTYKLHMKYSSQLQNDGRSG